MSILRIKDDGASAQDSTVGWPSVKTNLSNSPKCTNPTDRAVIRNGSDSARRLPKEYPMSRNLQFAPVLSLGIVLAITGSAYASTFKVTYTFGANGTSDAALPGGRLVMDAAGNLYGTTVGGGAHGGGTVFELSPSANGDWTEKVLYSFSGIADGGGPLGGVVLDAKGNLYGTTQQGGMFSSGTCAAGCGVA